MDELVPIVMAAFRANELDCSLWYDDVLSKLAAIAIAAIEETDGTIADAFEVVRSRLEARREVS